MSPAAKRIVEILAPYTPFADAIVRRQAERAGMSVEHLDADDLRRIGRDVIAAASVFVEPPVLYHLEHVLGLR